MATPKKIKDSNGKYVRHPATKAWKWKIAYKDGDKWTSGYCWANDEAGAYAEIAKREQAPEITIAELTWKDGLNLWLDIHDKPGANKLAPDTIYAMCLNVKLLIEKLGNIPVSSTTKSQINDFLLSRSKVSGATANRARCVLSLANWLRRFRDVHWPWRNDDFATFNSTPKTPRREIELENIQKYLVAIDSVSEPQPGEKRYRGHPGVIEDAPGHIFRFLFLTGIRSSEACNMSEPDLNNAILTFRQKGNRARTLVCIQPVLDILNASIKEKRKHGITHDKIFFNTHGLPWNRDSLRHCWVRRLRAAKLPYRKIHEIRHTFCTLAAGEKFNEKMIQAASGHLSVEALRVYTHATKEMQIQVSEAVASKIIEKICVPTKISTKSLPKSYQNFRQKSR